MKFFFHENDLESELIFKRIAVACEGLVYVSEIDAPVTPFAAPAMSPSSPEVLLRAAHREASDRVEQTSFTQLFDRLTVTKDWHGELERARAKKFLELREVLEDVLDQLTVYRLGEIRIDIFAVGMDRSGRLMGVMTQAVET